MSYTNSTTHYGFPLPLGTDLTVPMDYNQAMNDIDENLFDAVTDASTAATAAANAVETANGAAADVADLGSTVNAHGGRLTSLEQHDIVQDNKIDAAETAIDNKFDSVGIADAYLNGLTYAVGDVVTYNGQRYKCITAVTAAEPFDSDKWQGEDVQTVIDDIYSSLSGLYQFKSTRTVTLATADGTKTIGQLLTQALTALRALTPSYTHSKILSFQFPTGDGSAARNAFLYESAINLFSDFSERNLVGVGNAGTATSVTTYYLNAGASTPVLTSVVCNDGGNTIVDYTSRVPSSGTKVDVLLDEFERIS